MKTLGEIIPKRQESKGISDIEVSREEINTGKALIEQLKGRPGFFINALNIAGDIASRINRKGPNNLEFLRNAVLVILVSSFSPGCSTPAVEEVKRTTNVEQPKTSKPEQKEQLPLPKFTEQQVADLARTSDVELMFLHIPGEDIYYQIAKGENDDQVIFIAADVPQVEEIIMQHEQFEFSHIHPLQGTYEDLGITTPLSEQELQDKLYSAPSPADLAGLSINKLDSNFLYTSRDSTIKIFDSNATWGVKLTYDGLLVNAYFTTALLSPEKDENWAELKKTFPGKEASQELDELKTDLVEYQKTLQERLERLDQRSELAGKSEDRNQMIDITKSFKLARVRITIRTLYEDKLSRYETLGRNLRKALAGNSSKSEIQKQKNEVLAEAKRQGFEITYQRHKK